MSTQDNTTALVAWVDIEQRVASFHKTKAGEERTFHTKEYFMQYLQELQLEGFRFQ